LFTLYKALSAVELARSAEAALGRPVVPVFWVAGDDHDFAEANHCFILDQQGDLQQIDLRERDPKAPLTPLYREQLGPQVEAALERLRGTLPESEFRESVIDWLIRHYRPDTDFASAFSGAMAELLGAHGLVVFNASHVAAKRAMAPWLRRALTEATALDRALASRAGELLAAGREVPVTVGEGATPVMMEGALGRDRLVFRDNQYATRRAGESWEATQLTELVERAPERFSPNVLLRPVLEAAILPTLAYVGGPSELAYLEQSDPLYQGLGVTSQARVPRWSGRVIEARVRRTLDKLDITADALGREAARLEADLLREGIPAQTRAALEKLRSEIQKQYEAIVSGAVEVDPTLQKPVESARNTALAGLTDVEKRLLAHLKKRNDIAMSQLARARTSLFPRDQPQERLVASISFLARYGPPFVDQALDAVRSWIASLEPAQRQS
jgi:bacillithiol biosynthesis cysteine-adding enzyme BshC